MKQKTKPPDKCILWGFVIANILILVFMAWVCYNTLKATENPPESQIKRNNSEIILVGGNSLKASAPVVHIEPRVYAIMAGGLEINEAELLERLWFCEASNRHEGVWGDNGRAYGAFQFWQPTWNQYCKGSRYDFESQVECARFMIFELRVGHQHWVNCFRKMGLNQYLTK